MPEPQASFAGVGGDPAALGSDADTHNAQALLAMRRLWHADESACVALLAGAAELSATQRARIEVRARELIEQLQRLPERHLAEILTHRLALDSPAGLALLSLAEALLRVPDAATADRLIRDKLAGVDWRAAGLGGPMALALQLGSALVGPRLSPGAPMALLRRLPAPLLRWAARQAMRLIGGRFVFAETIEAAVARARTSPGGSSRVRPYRYSFDMLGEAALTAEDAERYLRAYEHAIHVAGAAYRGLGPVAAGSVSVKLSALHPRYEYAQRERVARELAPRLRELAALARRYDIGLTIDAEECDRLELSLELLESLLTEPSLTDWTGLGLAVQAYQKRAPALIDYLAQRARARSRRLMVRLVKGAYWDAEIKLAQLLGLSGYPVYTRKVHTDVSYLACARRLLAARDSLEPQFATHNAYTVAEILELATGEVEFQCLHGMGDTLYRALQSRIGAAGVPRVYAPVGPRSTLLPYLMRRLLENGAASSFVHRAARPGGVSTYVAPVVAAARNAYAPHPRIPLPRDLYLPERRNSAGVDLADPWQRAALERAVEDGRRSAIEVAPIVAASAAPSALVLASAAQRWEIHNPADRRDRIGTVLTADEPLVDAALGAALSGAERWAETAVETRAGLLEGAADLYEQHTAALVALAVREAGKTLADGVAEVREAVDYLRYYAAQSRAELAATAHAPLGPVVCISPWNFPLAIFTGQIAAALAAGNAVLAKPAEQTNAIAAAAVGLLRAAGIPDQVLQLLPGAGERVGVQLVADARVRGVVFTGSGEAARAIARALAARGEVPLIAETGGQNAMIVDSTVLAEQVVADVLRSAFDSAGQRCSALRVLCLQHEIAEPVLEMLAGAMRELRVGDPAQIATDVGPLIDAEACARIQAHLQAMRGSVRCQSRLSDECAHGTFVPPTLIDIESISELKAEVFGPVLHVLRFDRRRLGALVDAVNATGFGLTLGIASRVEETVAEIIERCRIGNVYVNRNMIGAVVGVQPFGGLGLSGTGPKAGGPFYLHRLLRRSPGPRWPRAAAGQPPQASRAMRTLIDWLQQGAGMQLGPIDREYLRLRAERYAQRSLVGARLRLHGYVGESNELRLRPRGVLRATARSPRALLEQLAAAVATGNRIAIDDAPLAESLSTTLPPLLHPHCHGDPQATVAVLVDQVEATLNPGWVEGLRRELAQQEGPIVPLLVADDGYALEQLLAEQTVTINTAAVGGDPQLLSLAD
jgi:RHH-type transcriptional regulator, proline utilization regulon repressor / proline dehydrogenase / delta 1-pyrroline-5-carboxylate dehydrogenase